MTSPRAILRAFVLFTCGAACLGMAARGEDLRLPPGALGIVDQIYSGDLQAAGESARGLQKEYPEHPLGYLLEAEAQWWKIWCAAAEFKYGMNYARHRAKLESDQAYLDLAARATALAEKKLKQQETAEMHFYAGTGNALAARLYGLRGENRNTARVGVRAREHLLRALALDPGFADADFALGLYNYYVDTLSGVARVLRFFMGIPSGSRPEGVRELQVAIAAGVLTSGVARFYLAISLENYDQQYEQALAVIGPLVERYPANVVFQLVQGDLYAKLGRKAQAIGCYRAAATLPVQDAECRTHIQELARAALSALGAKTTPAEE